MPHSTQRCIWALLVLLLIFEPNQCTTTNEGQDDEFVDWWETASFYQIYPKSFQDSDGDGVGDLAGITSRLEYLKEIGITATMLSPIFESPTADFDYAISDFTRIDPIFGTLDDFDAMIAKAKRLGIKIILEFEPNHTSDECEWFKKSVQRDGRYGNYYIWEDGREDPKNPNNRLEPSNWISVFGGSQWTWHPVRKQFYLHQFRKEQPDLNYNNGIVRIEMLDVFKYWLDRGVDGFRIDAIPYIFEARNLDDTYPNEPWSGLSQDPNSYSYHNHIFTKDQYPTIELLYEWREFLDEYQKENGGETRILLSETDSDINLLSQYIGNGTHHGVHIPMNFKLLYVTNNERALGTKIIITYWMINIWEKHHIANWLLGNKDNPRIRDRLGATKVDLMNIIANSLPGASVTYYGEEIGMSNVPIQCTEMCDDRNQERTPMQWARKRMAGFTNGPTTWLPIAADFQLYNVEVQRGIERSPLQIFKQMQKLKSTRAFKAFKQPGGFSVDAINTNVLQIVRSAENFEEYRILINMGNRYEEVEDLANKSMEIVMLNSYSPRNHGDKIDLSGRVSMLPNEAIILHWTV